MPEPSSVGGMKAISKMYYDLGIFEHHQYHHFDSTFSGSHKLGRFFQSILLRFKFIMLLIKLKPKGVFIYTSSYWGFYDKAFYALICRLFKINSALNLVGGEFFKFYQSNYFHRNMVKIFIRFPHKVIIGSTSWVDSFQKEFPKIIYYVIHNPVILSKPEVDGKKKGSTVKFIFFGRLVKEKGIEEIINAIEHLKTITNLTFHFVFAGKGLWADYIRVSLAEMINTGIVSVHEDVSEYEKDKLLKSSDVFVLPSHAEVLPISLLEAMGHGLPAIITNVGGMKDAVINGYNGFVIDDLNDTTQELIQLMLYFMENPQQTAIMGQRALQTIEEQFEFSAIFKNKINLFK